MPQPVSQLLRSALFEAFFVVLGVVLALGANEWRQDRADQAHARRALAAITEELAANRAAVQASHDYHQDRLRAIYAAQSEGEALAPRDFPRGFIGPAQVYQTAWEAARETGALSDLDYATLLALSRAYESQDRYEAQARAVGGIIYEQMFREGVDSVAAAGTKLAALIHTFRFREEELLSSYDEVLAVLDGAS